MGKKKAPGQLLAEAYEVAQEYIRNETWKSEENACRALRRRCPAFSEEECRESFDKACKLFADTRSFVDKKSRLLWQRWKELPEKRRPLDLSVDDLAKTLADKRPGFPAPVYRDCLVTIFVYYHVM